jgi:hypothetical protein
LRVRHLIAPGLAALALAAASTAEAASGGGSATAGAGTSGAPTSMSGGAGVAPGPTPPSTPLHPIVAGSVAKIINGLAYAPSYAPLQVQEAIWAGDAIRHQPDIYGGGHGTWNAPGYDCSGTVSYVLHAAGLLKVSMDSGEFMSWGDSGAGQWMTIYTNPGHAFIEIAGIRLDTSAEGDPNPPPGTGPRWRPLLTDTSGYVARHPAGF